MRAGGVGLGTHTKRSDSEGAAIGRQHNPGMYSNVMWTSLSVAMHSKKRTAIANAATPPAETPADDAEAALDWNGTKYSDWSM